MSAFATVARKTFNGKFYVTLTDAAIGSLNFFHLSFDKYLDYMMMLVTFEHNRMIRNVHNFELFEKNVDAILEGDSVT